MKLIIYPSGPLDDEPWFIECNCNKNGAGSWYMKYCPVCADRFPDDLIRKRDFLNGMSLV